jgi:polyferredoxin
MVKSIEQVQKRRDSVTHIMDKVGVIAIILLFVGFVANAPFVFFGFINVIPFLAYCVLLSVLLVLTLTMLRRYRRKCDAEIHQLRAS